MKSLNTKFIFGRIGNTKSALIGKARELYRIMEKRDAMVASDGALRSTLTEEN